MTRWMMTRRMATALAASSLLATAVPAQPAVTPDMIQRGSDIPAHWNEDESKRDYIVRDVMIPMRDRVKLHTVIARPRSATGPGTKLPILLERTPYEASGFLHGRPLRLRDAVAPSGREWVDDGYILVFQDVRGKYGSQGDYIVTRPPIGSLNPTKTDDTTDAWDTIDWLVRNLPESNGRVGMIGSSYDGWAAAMALLGPHPALKVAAPESPMVDGWMGDDWFHYGAFRQVNLDYFTEQTSHKDKGEPVTRRSADDYRTFLEAGSAGAYAAEHGFDALPWWKRLSAHPAYDAFWQYQALDKLVAAKPSRVPTLWLQGLWDQEDMYGAIHAWQAMQATPAKDDNYLAMGPWWHSQINGYGDHLGPLKWRGDTSADFRRDVLVPFFDTYLKDRAPARPMPRAQIYNAAENRWDRFAEWPGPSRPTPLFLGDGNRLSFDPPASSGADSYVSDPAKPVPFLPPPVAMEDHPRWSTWLVQDQRPAATRTDVLSYQTAVLDKAVTVRGAPLADIFARTTGTDGDIVVKIIDVYPDTFAQQPELAGYQLPVSLDIFRGRYRTSFEHPSPVPSGAVQEYRFALPTMNYVFKPGHRIMVQIQSSLFPLYDRNPQTYVPNIFFAGAQDYRKAIVSIERGGNAASTVLLPIVPEGGRAD